VVPFVNEILSTDLSGTTAVLTKTNDEALQITGLLLKNGIPAKLIQSNDGFSLYNLFEIRSFIDDLSLDESNPIISKEAWNIAKRKFAKKHSKSSNYNLCKMLLVDFQEINPKVKYSSDFEIFIRESKLEDFVSLYGETILVSTIHKAKGKEFDIVFIMLDSFNTDTDDAKRQLYVAMTRAKQNLTIHYNGNFLDNIEVEELHQTKNTLTHPLPRHLVYHLTHKDINLGYFKFIQRRLDSLISGDSLGINEYGLVNSHSEQIVKFSKTFQAVKESLKIQGYQLIESKIRFILLWENNNENTDEENEIKIVLPELCFRK
jgi:ATP-dependent DNA helicase RecQ